jgi:hypothetical protein
VLCLLASLSPTPGFAAEVITDGDMEIAPLTNWTASTGTTAGTRSKATDQFNTTASSLKFETDKLQATAVEWWESQSVGIVNATDTVVLNLWWGAQWAIAAGTAGTVYFDVKPASGSWTTAWSQVLTPSTSFQSGTAVNQTISDSFTTTDTYEVRLRFAGNTGDNKNARMNVWWDTVSLDVTGPACVHAQPTVTMVTGDQTVCPGGTANYTFTATNNCSAGCSDESFNLSYGDDTGNFTSSGPGSTGLLTPGATSGNLTLTVDLTAAATGTNTSTITAALASHTDGTNSDAQTTADTTPPGDPSFSSCTGVSTSEIDLVFTDPGTSAGGGVVVVRGMPAGTAPDWAPTDGQAPPTEGTTDPGTGDVFVFVGTGTSDSDISLAANQSYSYEVWAYDGCNNYTTTEVPTTCSTQAAGNNAPTISSTQADDTVTSGTNITTCAGRDVTITATADDLDSDPLDWTVHTGQSPSFSTCTSETVQTPPDPMSCIISSIATTTDYYMEATDGTDTTTDPSGAPGTYYTITVDRSISASAIPRPVYWWCGARPAAPVRPSRRPTAPATAPAPRGATKSSSPAPAPPTPTARWPRTPATATRSGPTTTATTTRPQPTPPPARPSRAAARPVPTRPTTATWKRWARPTGRPPGSTTTSRPARKRELATAAPRPSVASRPPTRAPKRSTSAGITSTRRRWAPSIR